MRNRGFARAYIEWKNIENDESSVNNVLMAKYTKPPVLSFSVSVTRMCFNESVNTIILDDEDLEYLYKKYSKAATEEVKAEMESLMKEYETYSGEKVT